MSKETEAEFTLRSLKELLIGLKEDREIELKNEKASPNYHPFSYMDGYIRGKLDLLNSLIDSAHFKNVPTLKGELTK